MSSPTHHPPAPPLDSDFPHFPDDPSSASVAFDWANLLDFTIEDQFSVLWNPDGQTSAATAAETSTPSIPSLDSVSEASNRGSDSSDKIRKRDPRLTCENFLAGRIPCSCPEVDEMNEVEQVEVEKKQRRRLNAGLIRCQVPECGVDISGLKGYHKRHRICLRCAHAGSVVLDGEAKRFCQQCGKFHILPDFDEGRRSCRRKLAWHNRRRRRKPAESKGTLDTETQVDQLADYIACEDNEGKDVTLNESEDGNVSPLNSQPDSQITQHESVKSFASVGETQMEGGLDNPKSSPLEDNKNSYSSVCPTGRISFKLYDWNPAEFPRRLRHQIFQWLANMPVELEGYIRPGCTILTAFIAMPNFMWEKLSDDGAQHIQNFLNASESVLFGRGSMSVYLNDAVFSVLDGATSMMNDKRVVLPPRLHYVYPSCFESGKPMEFVACGSNFLQSRFRFLVSFAGRYLAYDDIHVMPYYGNKEDSATCLEHQIYKIYISCTDPALIGPAFVEVENEFGISNFIPVLFADKHICSEMKLVEQRLNDALFSKELQQVSLDAITEPCKNFVTRQATISELLLDIGWLLKDPKFDDMQNHLTSTHIQRATCLLHFLIHNKFTVILEKLLCTLNIVIGAKNFSTHNDVDTRPFNKCVEHARKIIQQGLHDVEGPVSCTGSSVEKDDYWSNCHREGHTYSAIPSPSEDMKTAKNSLGAVTKDFQGSDESAPLINKEVVMNMTYEPHQGKVWPQRTYTRFLPTTTMSSRPLFLMVAVSVVCFGVCAVVLHPNKVGEVAVSIHRCLFGNSKP